MKTDQVTISSGKQKLAATIVLPVGNPKAALLRLSGGFNVGHRENDWQDVLAGQGIASMAFDFAGVGHSTGILEDTSLESRLQDAREVASYFHSYLGNDVPIYLLGISMGGPVAIWLASELEFAGLILAVAAAYPRNAYGKNFGEAFSQAIRGEGLWHDSREFRVLEGLSMPIFFASASDDQVIPKGITERYLEVVRGKGQRATEYQAPHQFLRKESLAPDEKARFWQDVIKFLAQE